MGTHGQQRCNLGSHIREAFGLYTAHFSQIVGLGFIYCLLGVPISYYFEAAMGLKVDNLGLIPPAATLQDKILPLTVALIFAVIMLMMMAAFLEAYKQENAGVNPFGLYAKAAQSFVAFLLGFVFLGGATVLGLVLFVIPGIVFAVQYSLAPIIGAYEGKVGLTALRRSREFTQGHWWSMAIHLLSMLLVFFPLNMTTAFTLHSLHASLLVEQLSFNMINAFLAFPFIFALWSVTYAHFSKDPKNTPLHDEPTDDEAQPNAESSTEPTPQSE